MIQKKAKIGRVWAIGYLYPIVAIAPDKVNGVQFAGQACAV